MTKNFYQFKTIKNIVDGVESEVVELRIEGDIIDDSDVWMYEWFEEPHTAPNAFRNELRQYEGQDLNVIVDTYGGDVFAAASIYSELKKRTGRTVGIVESKAMSAGTVILMGCDEIRMSAPAVMMIHDPITSVYGGIGEIEKTLNVLNTIKDSIINAYEAKTGLERKAISKLMSEETWMSANEAVTKGFADKVIDTVSGSFGVGVINRMQVFNSAAQSAELLKKHDEMKFKAMKEQEELKNQEIEIKELTTFIKRTLG